MHHQRKPRPGFIFCSYYWHIISDLHALTVRVSSTYGEPCQALCWRSDCSTTLWAVDSCVSLILYIRDKWVTASHSDTEKQTKMQRWGAGGEEARKGAVHHLHGCGLSFAVVCGVESPESRGGDDVTGGCVACRATAASFRSRSTFLRSVVKEMSSEQKPIWQLRVKWGEKSKSHSIWERLRGAYLQAEITNSLPVPLTQIPPPPLCLFPCGSTQEGLQSASAQINI